MKPGKVWIRNYVYLLVGNSVSLIAGAIAILSRIEDSKAMVVTSLVLACLGWFLVYSVMRWVPVEAA